MESKFINYIVDGKGFTVELTSAVTNLFDYCTMLQQQLQKGTIPINAELHSISKIGTITITLGKQIPPELLDTLVNNLIDTDQIAVVETLLAELKKARNFVNKLTGESGDDA
jgi:hypothetical protein